MTSPGRAPAAPRRASQSVSRPSKAATARRLPLPIPPSTRTGIPSTRTSHECTFSVSEASRSSPPWAFRFGSSFAAWKASEVSWTLVTTALPTRYGRSYRDRLHWGAAHHWLMRSAPMLAAI